jgi:hypothetical protein
VPAESKVISTQRQIEELREEVEVLRLSQACWTT